MDKIAITGARVFDGHRVVEGATVVIEGAIIGTDPAGATVVDGTGHTLLPGLIDCHVHLHGPENLRQARTWGITTMLDMGTYPASLVDSLRDQPDLPDIRSAYAPAGAPGGIPSRLLGLSSDAAIAVPEDAARFVRQRVAEGADYIKIIIEDPRLGGPAAFDAARVTALVDAAHADKLLTIAHVTTLPSIQLAAACGVDIITHVPLGPPVDAGTAANLAANATVAIPTLVMMEAVAAHLAHLAAAPATPPPPPGMPRPDFANATRSVAALLDAGVSIVAGSDANNSPAAPASIAHGEGLHRELELLVDAGLTPLDALAAATSRPAARFALADRGRIAPGLRADLLLVEGDPTTDIRHTRNIRQVWCNGLR